jgi:hypothetical protein
MQRDCTLLCYDTGGECFEKPTQLVQYARFVKQAQTAMFLVSVPKLQESPVAQQKESQVPQNMHKLLETYVVGMGELGAHTQDQHLVVVYTQADEMVTYFTKPWEDLRNYLTEGSVDGLVRPEGYVKRMYKVSERLGEFTQRELQAHEFMHMAKASFRSVTFSIISALGTKPYGRKLPVEIVPRRVIDPLLWMMEKSLSSRKHFWQGWWR